MFTYLLTALTLCWTKGIGALSPSFADGGDIVIDHTGDKPVTSVEGEGVEVDHIPCHRVVVAARCDWFRRALLSGMRESIDKWVAADLFVAQDLWVDH